MHWDKEKGPGDTKRQNLKLSLPVFGFAFGMSVAFIVHFGILHQEASLETLSATVYPGGPPAWALATVSFCAAFVTGNWVLEEMKWLATRHARREMEKARARCEMETEEQLEMMRHDFFNKLTVISVLLQTGAVDRCLDYVHEALAPVAAGEADDDSSDGSEVGASSAPGDVNDASTACGGSGKAGADGGAPGDPLGMDEGGASKPRDTDGGSR